MKIRYLHTANTNEIGEVEEKIHDTEKAFRNCVSPLDIRSGERTQAEWDEFTLKKFEEDLKKGIVLSYSVIEEGAE